MHFYGIEENIRQTFTKDLAIKKNFIDALILVSNRRVRFSCRFLKNSGNVTPFLRWNKPEKRAFRERHFYGIY